MQSRASSHRYIVMESYVQMLGGKVKNIEETIQKLVSVLATVYIALFSVQSILPLCLPSL